MNLTRKYGAPGLLAMILLIAGCDRDEGPVSCLPDYLIVGVDSIVISYNTEGRLMKVKQFNQQVLNKLERTDEFTYDATGKMELVTRISHPFVGDPYVTSTMEIKYTGEVPSSITQLFASGARIVTEYGHDEMGRLVTANTLTAGPGATTLRFAGSSRYEYDANGNIPKVFYTINRNSGPTEVLARENTAFDDHVTFYDDIGDLRLYNNYINSYLPNQNNCLSSVIYYYSYTQRYTTPQNVSFVPSYYSNGKISGLVSDPPAQSNFSGDVLFSRVRYQCDPATE